MASADDKRRLIYLARNGLLDDIKDGPDAGDGFRSKLKFLNLQGINGPGHDYGLDYSDRPFYRSALWEATWRNHEPIVRMLLTSNATVDFADYEGRTPLHEAAYYGHLNLVMLFIEKDHPVDPLDNYGQTPLFRAAESGHHDVVEYLVTKKAETNRLDCNSATIQHCAAFKGVGDLSEWLYFRGAYKNRYYIQTEGEGKKERSTNTLAFEKAPRPTEEDEAAKETLP